MRISMLFVVLAGSLLAATTAAARTQDVPPPPPPPPGYQGSAPPAAEPRPAPPQVNTPIEPEVTITTRGTDRVEEYRYNGQLYMLKITPKHGIPYYLIDEQGRGQFRRSDLQPKVSPPMWVLKRF